MGIIMHYVLPCQAFDDKIHGGRLTWPPNCEKSPFDTPAALRVIFRSIPSSPELHPATEGSVEGQSEGRIEGCCAEDSSLVYLKEFIGHKVPGTFIY